MVLTATAMVSTAQAGPRTSVGTANTVLETPAGGRVTVSKPAAYGISAPLRNLAAVPTSANPTIGEVPNFAPPAGPVGAVAQPQVEALRGGKTGTAPSPKQSFEGLGDGFVGPQGTFHPDVIPPDPNGDVGLNHYVQMVNMALAVFIKDGTPVYGPVPINTLFAGIGGLCQTHNDGDPIVKYDRMADRWLVSQFAVESGGPDYQCIAVSRTPDPAGAYALYAYEYNAMNDYPKLGVWPDAYYATYNMFDATSGTSQGAKTCAFDRTAMLAGVATSNQQCFDFQRYAYLPSDLDGNTPPPPGSPNYIVGQNIEQNGLNVYRFHVDWADASKSSLTGPANVPVSPYVIACASSYRGRCIVQPGNPAIFPSLEALNRRTMYRLSYRNFGDHESLVTNMAVAATQDPNGQSAVRWLEIRSPGTAPNVYQEGTFAPDTTYRWAASAAMDRNQNLALGYSRSSSVLEPDIAYTGRLAADPPGTLQQEQVVPLPSTGGQYHSRWGDYTSMSVDPVDDCTFWYTNQYQPANGIGNWHTRIISFKFPSCLVPQTISFAQPPKTPLARRSVALRAQASSGLPVVFTSLTPKVCLVSAATARLLAVGTCRITANQPGNEMYAPAPQVLRSFIVSPLVQLPVNSCVTAPQALPLAGVARLTKPGCATNAGRAVQVTARCARITRGDLVNCRLVRDARGSYYLRTYGHHVHARITWSAPAGGNYWAYQQTREYLT